MNKQINQYDYLRQKINYCSTCVFFIHAPCFLMCILFYVSFIWLHVYAFAIHSMVHCGSAFEPGASGLPYYCTSICVRSCCTWRATCVNSKPKKNKKRGNRKERKIDPWALRFLVGREIDCGNWLARGYMPAHQHCDLFCPLLIGDLLGSAIN
jgi:hypothetical protein